MFAMSILRSLAVADLAIGRASITLIAP